ncbi:DUF1330 domain-containing protein [Kordiimonas pumila]|uniref:DUF1330 domain-containing protein n=1 Tax=Kordiimonas pumila TaxID=2161677 RepID=A0ABV7DAF1_9PROT|nr:DUF1330 domain-containing protein [Kordiimonas pumila]
MSVNLENHVALEKLMACYGDGSDGTAPTPEVWAHIFERDDTAPLTLINFFKLRDIAAYPAPKDAPAPALSGQEAFNRYAAVSMPTMQSVGGRFLHMGPFEGMFCGSKEAWDLIVVGAYPNTKALISLVSNEDYISAYKHRRAACEKQKVYLSGLIS